MSHEPHHLRPFSWDDLVSLHTAMNAAEDPLAPARTVEQLRVDLGMPGRAPERDLQLALRDNAVIGYAWLLPEQALGRAVGVCGVRPACTHEGIWRDLYAALEARTAERGLSRLHVQVDASDGLRGSLLERQGYRVVRDFYTLQADPRTCPVVAKDRTTEIRPFGHDGDLEKLTSIQNAAFEGSFGFCPNTPSEIEKYVALRGGPEGILLAEQDGAWTGYVWTSADGHKGRVEMMGVRPDLRGKRIGGRLLRAGLQHLAQRGVSEVRLDVDAKNDPALRLYGGHGFQNTAVSHWFEKALNPS